MARRSVALAAAALAALAVLVQASALPSIRPAEARLWEGQQVAVHGVARSVRATEPGARFDLVLDGHALPVRSDEAPPEGAPVVAQGRVARFGGTLTLLADQVRADDPIPGEPVPLAALAHDPERWRGRIANVTGTVERGQLRADGITIALGDGPWPKAGPVAATVVLAYDAACACNRLDRVTAWTR